MALENLEMQNSKAAVALTADNDNDLAQITNHIYVGTGGHLTVILANDTVPVLFKNVPSGTKLDLRVKRLMVTGTSAADIVALY